jgi:hypothetical protein
MNETRRMIAEIGGNRVEVEITVNWDYLALDMGRRVRHNKSGKSSAMAGAIKARRMWTTGENLKEIGVK